MSNDTNQRQLEHLALSIKELIDYGNRFPDEPMIRMLKEFNVIKDHPRMIVMVCHGFVELVINGMIDAKCKNAKKISDDARSYPHSVKLLILHELEVLSDHHFALLNWFRKLRNDFAHDPFFTVTANHLNVFVRDEYRDPANLFGLCGGIIADLFDSSLVAKKVMMPEAGSAFPDMPSSPPYRVAMKSD